jgi:hypothetical protein
LGQHANVVDQERDQQHRGLVWRQALAEKRTNSVIVWWKLPPTYAFYEAAKVGQPVVGELGQVARLHESMNDFKQIVKKYR